MKHTVKASDGNGVWTIDEVLGKCTYSFKAYDQYWVGRSQQCIEMDPWDEQRGKRIAYLRAVEKMKKYKMKQLQLDLDIAIVYCSDFTINEIRTYITEEMEGISMAISKIRDEIASLSE